MKLKKLAALFLVVTFVVTLCSTSAMASDYGAEMAGIASVAVAPAKVNSNGTVSWYSSFSYIHAAGNSKQPGNITTDLGKIKSLVAPSTANGWTGFFIEVSIPNAGAAVTANVRTQSEYRNRDSYGFYVAYDDIAPWDPTVVITSRNGGYTYTCTVDLSLDGTYTLRPSGSMNTIG